MGINRETSTQELGLLHELAFSRPQEVVSLLNPLIDRDVVDWPTDWNISARPFRKAFQLSRSTHPPGHLKAAHDGTVKNHYTPRFLLIRAANDIQVLPFNKVDPEADYEILAAGATHSLLGTEQYSLILTSEGLKEISSMLTNPN